MYRRPARQWQPTDTVLKPRLAGRRSFGSKVTLSPQGKTLVAFADQDDGLYGIPYVVAFDQKQNRWQQTAVFKSTAEVPIPTGWANSLALSWSGRYLTIGARQFSTESTSWGAVLNYGRQSAPKKK